MVLLCVALFFFFFNDPPTTEISPLSLHDALPISVDPLFQPAYIGLGWIYMLNGQYDVARTAFDRAVEIEETGRFKEIRFVGGLTLRAGLDLREGRWEDARTRLRRALERYEGTDHVYAEAFAALSYCGLAEIEERASNYDRAVEHYTRAGVIIAQHPERLGGGYLRVKAGLGRARAFHPLQMRRGKECRSRWSPYH